MTLSCFVAAFFSGFFSENLKIMVEYAILPMYTLASNMHLILYEIEEAVHFAGKSTETAMRTT
jgi:hypothetical protein